MQTTTYPGNGTTTEFYFDFPYFDNKNIIVTINNTPAPEHTIIGTPGGQNADFPYIGGKVVFDTAPTSMDTITITRKLSLSRIVDYQPLSHITPKLLNQDLNYLIEIAKDFHDELTNIHSKYSAIIDQETTENIINKFEMIRTEISKFKTDLNNLGDINAIQKNIATNTDDISSLKDAQNFTPSGKSTLSNLAMPSKHYEDLELLESGSSYIAPADGYYYLCKTATANNQSVKLTNEDNLMSCENISVGASNWCRSWLPVSKGTRITATYTSAGETRFFRFIYANSAM